MPLRAQVLSVSTPSGEDFVVREEALLIGVGEHLVLTMRTPGDDADLALGFLVSEGIVAAATDVTRIELGSKRESEGPPVDTARAHLAAGKELGPVAKGRLTRAHAIRPSCGLCGLVSAEGLTRHLRPLPGHEPKVDLGTLWGFAQAMRERQPVFEATGGSHAAAIFSIRSGELWAVREDVGRHNALDKALGACLAAGRDLSIAAVLLSGRGGYELVLKALRLGAPVVASVSAPSSLAVELAEEHGQTLVGFLRDGQGRVYADDGRII